MVGIEVRVEIMGNRIGLVNETRFPGDNEMCKDIPGHSFRKTPFPHWTYPLSLSTCRELRRVFRDMLVIGPELTAWAAEEIRKAKRLARLGRRKDVSLPLIQEDAPWIYDAMSSRKYQRVGARFLAAAKPGAGIFDSPGLGKTLQALAALVEADAMFGGHLIVAPLTSLKPVWLRDIKHWLRTDEVYVHTGHITKRQQTIDAFWERDVDTKFLIINPDMLATVMGEWCDECEAWEDHNAPDGQKGMPVDHWVDKHKSEHLVKEQRFPDLWEIPWRSVIADEAHGYLHGNRGPRKKTQVAEGICRLQYDDDPIRIAATGSAFRGRLQNIWGIFNWLRPEEYPSFWHWADTYLETTEGRFGVSVGDLKESKAQEFYEDIDRFCIRRSKHEVQEGIPEIQRHDIWVEMEEKQRKQYQSMEDAGEARMEDGEILSPIGILAELSRLKQFAFGTWKILGYDDRDGKRTPIMEPVASPKLDYFIDFLKERGITGNPKTDFVPDDKNDGHKIIFASQYTRVVDFVCEQLQKKGIPSLKITGAVSEKRRTEVERIFQSYEGPRVLGLQTIAGGQSLTLDAYCDEGVIFDETWVPDDQEQIEGRIDNRQPEKRIHSVDWYYIRTKGTIDVAISNGTLTKAEVQKRVLDIRRGVKVTLHEIQYGGG